MASPFLPMPAPEAPAQPIVQIVAPADGDVVEGPTLMVDAVASQALGAVRFEVRVGQVILGSLPASIDRAGTLSEAVPVVAPMLPVPVEVRVVREIAGDGADSRVLAATHPSIVSRSPLDVRLAEIGWQSGRAVLAVDAFGPATANTVQVAVSVDGGAYTDAGPLAEEPEFDAAALLFGLRRVSARLALANLPKNSCQIRLSWNDSTAATRSDVYLTVRLPTQGFGGGLGGPR